MERINQGGSTLIKQQSCNGGGRNMKEMNQDNNNNNNNNSNSCNKVKNLWDLRGESNGGSCSEADLLGLFAWPPRSYTCTFCKREFRSAQALGGHMNVHRRDRARLRQSPPPPPLPPPPTRDLLDPYNSLLNLNHHPNPNDVHFKNSNPSFSPAKPPPPAAVSTFSTTPPTTTVVTEMRKWGKSDFVGFGQYSSSPPRTVKSSQDVIRSTKSTKRLFELERLGSLKHEKETSALMKNSENNIVRLELEIGLLSEVKQDLDLELRLGYI